MTAGYLLQANIRLNNVDNAASYLPIAIQLAFAIVFIGAMMVLTHWLGPTRKTSDKLENFASGIESHGDARQPMAIKYFLVAILFVLFDVEVSWRAFFILLRKAP
jgi:NADH-quinone oxidoreductase subunit A